MNIAQVVDVEWVIADSGMKPEGMPEGEEPPTDDVRPERPEGEMGERPEGFNKDEQPNFSQETDSTEKLTTFTLSDGGVFLYSLSETSE